MVPLKVPEACPKNDTFNGAKQHLFQKVPAWHLLKKVPFGTFFGTFLGTFLEWRFSAFNVVFYILLI